MGRVDAAWVSIDEKAMPSGVVFCCLPYCAAF